MKKEIGKNIRNIVGIAAIFVSAVSASVVSGMDMDIPNKFPWGLDATQVVISLSNYATVRIASPKTFLTTKDAKFYPDLFPVPTGFPYNTNDFIKFIAIPYMTLLAQRFNGKNFFPGYCSNSIPDVSPFSNLAKTLQTFVATLQLTQQDYSSINAQYANPNPESIALSPEPNFDCFDLVQAVKAQHLDMELQNQYLKTMQELIPATMSNLKIPDEKFNQIRKLLSESVVNACMENRIRIVKQSEVDAVRKEFGLDPWLHGHYGSESGKIYVVETSLESAAFTTMHELGHLCAAEMLSWGNCGEIFSMLWQIASVFSATKILSFSQASIDLELISLKAVMSLELGTFLFCYQSVANSSTESLKVESHDNFCIMNLIEKILPGLHPTAKTEAGQMMKKSFEWFIEMPHDNYSLFPDTRYGFCTLLAAMEFLTLQKNQNKSAYSATCTRMTLVNGGLNIWESYFTADRVKESLDFLFSLKASDNQSDNQ